MFTANSSTTDPLPAGLLVRIEPHDGGYLVKDFTGLRYGFGKTLREAVEEWADEVQWFVAEPLEILGGSALHEAKAYRRALPNG